MVRALPVVCIVLLFTGWQAQQTDSIAVMAIVEAVQTAHEVFEAVQKIRDYFKPDPTFDEQLTQKDLMVFDKLDIISARLEKFENRLFTKITQDFYDKFSVKTQSFYETIEYVDFMYRKFHEYSKSLTQEKAGIRKFSEDIFDSGFNAITHRIERMHNTLIKRDGQGENLLDVIASQKEPRLMCLRQQSAQQIIWELYQTVTVNDLKVLSLKLMSLQLRYNDTSEYKANSELEMNDFNERTKHTHDEVVKYLALASRDLWKCDPPQYKKDQSYSKLQEIFQGFITNEKDTEENSCKFSECEDLNTQKKRLSYEQHTEFSKLIPEKLQCGGYITNCQSTAEKIEYCVARPEDDRRYEGMSTNRTYGHYDKNCPNHNWDKDAKGDFLSLYNCKFCLCTCLSYKWDVDRYFSLEPAKSYVTRGMVVTGVRLKKINHVFYIEVQEGLLGPNGTILEKTNWLETPINKTANLQNILTTNRRNIYGDLLENKEVYSVHWEQRTVYLDDIKHESSGKDFVLTGLQFRQKNDSLFLQVRLSPFNYTTGEILDEGEWHDNAASTGRRKINLDKADDPLRYESHIIDSTSNQYIKFRATNYEADMGQFTVPFLDIQEVVTNPPTPIAGAGLYHKGDNSGKSGGFLGLKLTQYDISKHLL